MKYKRIVKFSLSLFAVLFFNVALQAQGDQIANKGKIYAVVTCVAVILIGIVAFLFYLERRIRSMEEIHEANF